MTAVKLVVLQQRHTRASEPPKAGPRHNNYQGTYEGTLPKKGGTPILLLSTEEYGEKKCSQQKFSQPPSVSFTSAATRSVGGA